MKTFSCILICAQNHLQKNENICIGFFTVQPLFNLANVLDGWLSKFFAYMTIQNTALHYI